jgi:hypothetical protein
MDDRHFDDLTRSFAGGRTRRGFLATLGGLALGVGRLARAEAATACPPGQFAGSGCRCLCRGTGRPPGPTGCGESPILCPQGLTLCGILCVNLATDPNHCGTCQTVCDAGGACLNGQCTCTPSCAGKCGGASDGSGGHCFICCPRSTPCVDHNQCCSGTCGVISGTPGLVCT